MIKTLSLSCGAVLEIIFVDDFDYAKKNTDEYWVDVVLNINNKKNIICSDFHNYVINNFLNRLNSLDDLEILDVFKSHDIGVAYNEYLYCIDNEKELNNDYLKEKGDFWIGNNFLLFELPQKTATWLYTLNGEIYLKITSIYEKHFHNSDELSYRNFISNNILIAEIQLTNDDIISLKKILSLFW